MHIWLTLDSGMTPTSLISYFISRKFHISKGALGTIIAVAQLVSSLGNIFASSVARRIGLISTSESMKPIDLNIVSANSLRSGVYTFTERNLPGTNSSTKRALVDDRHSCCKIKPECNGSSPEKCISRRSGTAGREDHRLGDL